MCFFFFLLEPPTDNLRSACIYVRVSYRNSSVRHTPPPQVYRPSFYRPCIDEREIVRETPRQDVGIVDWFRFCNSSKSVRIFSNPT